MFQHLTRVLAAEIALHKHNKVNRRGIVSPNAQHFHIIHDILPEKVFKGLREAANQLQSSSVRENSNWRKGQAIGGHELKVSGLAPWLEHVLSAAFQHRTRKVTGIETLALVPEADTNRISLLFYDAKRTPIRCPPQQIPTIRVMARIGIWTATSTWETAGRAS